MVWNPNIGKSLSVKYKISQTPPSHIVDERPLMGYKCLVIIIINECELCHEASTLETSGNNNKEMVRLCATHFNMRAQKIMGTLGHFIQMER